MKVFSWFALFSFLVFKKVLFALLLLLCFRSMTIATCGPYETVFHSGNMDSL